MESQESAPIAAYPIHDKCSEAECFSNLDDHQRITIINVGGKPVPLYQVCCDRHCTGNPLGCFLYVPIFSYALFNIIFAGRVHNQACPVFLLVLHLVFSYLSCRFVWKYNTDSWYATRYGNWDERASRVYLSEIVSDACNGALSSLLLLPLAIIIMVCMIPPKGKAEVGDRMSYNNSMTGNNHMYSM